MEPDAAIDEDDVAAAADEADAGDDEHEIVVDTDQDFGAVDPDDLDSVASNDEWAFAQADRQIKDIRGRIGKDLRTEGEVFDRSTLMSLHKLLSNGVLKSLDFPVSTGKEANVFRATTPEGGFLAVKIFRTNTATFKHVLQYIQGDDRFVGIAGDKRSLVRAWAQKEFRNLHRMRDAGVAVPEPICVLNNILVMEYLGTAEGPWPMLRQIGRLEDPTSAWGVLEDAIVRTYNKAHLVHADLSEYNVMVEDADTDAPVLRVIDVGQAVLRNHPMAQEFFDRDLRNLIFYFKRQGLRIRSEDVIAKLDRSN